MRSATGFTLIEVMITVAIVAILAAVAIPSYTDYITRSKIQEATTTLLAQRTKMEQYFQDQRTYSGACDPANSLTVLGILLMVALPSFGTWLQNQQLRAASEATLNGLQVARAAAIQRNVLVQFVSGPVTVQDRKSTRLNSSHIT